MTKNKHDHTATKKIKAWLFAIMLLLPFLFLLPTGLYYGLNQNAQLSEKTEQTPVYYETNEIINYTSFISGNAYMWTDNFTAPTSWTTSEIAQIKNTDNIQSLQSSFNNDILSLRYSSQNTLLYLTDNNGHFLNINSVSLWVVWINTINSNYLDDMLYNFQPYSYAIKEYTDITYTNDISTSIINAWNSTWQNPLFSWTNYSPFYAPMQSFTNVFGINDMQIANVLTYLATITSIYIVFDIIIELFTYLTHLIPRND